MYKIEGQNQPRKCVICDRALDKRNKKNTCYKHSGKYYSRKYHGLPINNLEKDLRLDRMIGKNNPRWNNGCSEYPNHALMKKNRLIKLQETRRICEICGKEGMTIHHKDGLKANHQINNLIVVCLKCHGFLHNKGPLQKKRMTKWKRYFGMSIDDVAKKLKKTPAQVMYIIYSRCSPNGAKNIKRKLKELDRPTLAHV
jgi:hypothetical protein